MKKLIALICVLALLLSFAVATIPQSAEARPPCIATCINGTYWVCCPGGFGAWYCFWDGPC
jgi:hypothetical protein